MRHDLLLILVMGYWLLSNTAGPECSGRRTKEAHFKGIEDFLLERDTLFDILADSRAVGPFDPSECTMPPLKYGASLRQQESAC